MTGNPKPLSVAQVRLLLDITAGRPVRTMTPRSSRRCGVAGWWTGRGSTPMASISRRH